MIQIQLPQLGGSDLITHSRMSCMKTCPRKAFYAYELGLRRDRVSTPLRMGTAVHEGIDLMAQGVDRDEAINRACEGYSEIPDWCNTDELIEERAIECETVRALLAGYHWRWGDDGSTVIATEQAFNMPIRNPDTGSQTQAFRVGGKIDKIVRLADGRVAVREHKTCGQDIAPDADYWRRLRLDQQISLYMMAARYLGHDVQTVEYDVIRKPGIRPRKLTKPERASLVSTRKWFGQTIDIDPENVPERETSSMFGARLLSDIAERADFYFQRMEIARMESDLDEFAVELWQMQQWIREAQKTGRFFRNTGACLMPYRCEYLDLCINGYNPDGGVPQGFKRLDEIHPELCCESNMEDSQ